jgi:DNA-binding transcriptional MerR regulator
VTTIAIPNRAVFRSQEVCELAEVQPYVLRTWEAEFPDLGLSKSAGAPRVYRRADIERVLRIKHLLLVEGLTLAGARRQLMEEGAIEAPPADADDGSVPDAEVAALLDREVRNNLRDVKTGLHWILGVLSGRSMNGGGEVRLMPAIRSVSRKAAKSARSNKSTRRVASSIKSRKPQRARKAAGKKRR